MEFIFIVAGMVLLLWLMSRLGQWLFDFDLTYWPYPLIGSYERMIEEVEIQRERQQTAIEAAHLARRYDEQMRQQRRAGQQRMEAISKAYVRKVQELIRR